MQSPLIVLVHGWCCDRNFWREQDMFGRNGIAVDLSDRGESAPPTDLARQTIAAFADDVVAVVNARGEESVVLVGHSMGGPVAIEAALRLGTRCRLVVGVDTFTDVNFYARLPRDEMDLRIAAFRADFHGTMNGMLDRIVLKSPAPGLRDWIASRMASVDVSAALAAFASLLEWDATERWPHVAVPVETINSAALARPRTTQVLPGLKVTEMAEVGHFPMLEDPQVFNSLLAGILDRHGHMP